MKIERPFWEKVQDIRQARVIDGDGRVHQDVIAEVAKVEALDVGLMKPIQRAAYRRRLARRL